MPSSLRNTVRGLWVISGIVGWVETRLVRILWERLQPRAPSHSGSRPGRAGKLAAGAAPTGSVGLVGLVGVGVGVGLRVRQLAQQVLDAFAAVHRLVVVEVQF